MKKGFLLVFVVFFSFLIVACGSNSKNERTEEQLLDDYVDAFTNQKYNKLKDIFIDFWLENYTEEIFNEAIQNIKNTYGDDYKISYKIESKNKISQDELAELNKIIKDYYNYEVSECYSLKVKLTYKGSLLTKDESDEFDYCKLNNKWYLSL